MGYPVGRRQLLAGAALCLSGCATPSSKPARLNLAKLHASMDRITQITVCTRPFREAGPRFDVEKIGAKIVVHNYGHGGSGWSLSWGSAALVVPKAMAAGERDIAVIGCGAIGLTTALLLQRAGAKVTIYAKELPPNVRSSLASGIWSPDSRICFEREATPEFKKNWEFMCRHSYRTYQSLLGLAGDPVEYIDAIGVRDELVRQRPIHPPDPRPQFAELDSELTPDLSVRAEEFAPGEHSLGLHYLRRGKSLMFNIPAYSRLLMSDFLQFGGKIEIAEFHSPADFARLPQNTLVNCTGYGARQLFGDSTVHPVRGQLAHLIPQPEVGYALFYKGISFIPRRDGLVFQVFHNDYYGFDDDGTAPDRGEAEEAVGSIASLFA